MSHRRSLSLLVLRGDGARVLQLTVGARAIAIAAVAVLIASASIGLVAWHHADGLVSEARALRQRLAEQQALIDRMNGTVRELRQEMAGWRDVHARLLDSFGPDQRSGARGTEIGGPAVPAHRALASLVPRDEVSELAATVAEEARNLRTLDRLLTRAAKMLAALPSRWPVRGSINSEFGNRPSPWASHMEFHSGIDIRAAKGTPVRAPAPGIVSFAGSHPEYGLLVAIDHGHDVKTVYGHLSKIDAVVGQQLQAGASIGLTGNTGRSSGPHLHYEIVVQGQPVNPRAYLWD